jgi:hypothetical protein
MQHRIFLAPIGPGVSWAEVQAHWRTNHEAITLELPGLTGYVQNRPRPDWWAQLRYVACSETWFADREAERRGFDSEWYHREIEVDEARMFTREAAWSSPVVATDVLREGSTGRFRALAFGGTEARLDGLMLDGRAEALRLLRPTPAGGEPVVVSVWTDHEELARHAAQRLGGIAFVAEPAAALPPAEAPWS